MKPETFPALPGQAATIDVSVVIVSYNTRDITLAAARSVLANRAGLAVELIVVDNDSQDGSAEALRAALPEARVISAGANGGYAWGNNLGLSLARGRHVLILNPDALLGPDTLAQAVARLDADPGIGCLGARVFYEDGAEQSTLFRYVRLDTLFWNIFVPNSLQRRTRLFGDQRYAGLSREAAQDVEVVAGCFMMVPRRVLEAVGPMDARFFMYSEESEWCARIARAGYRVRYDPAVRIVHLGGASTGRMSPWKAREIAKGQILFLRFTRGDGAARAGTLLLLAANVVRGPVALAQMLLGRREEARVWATRVGFLLGALWRLPAGQVPPPAPAALPAAPSGKTA